MSETNKKEAGVQEETEKDLPETEPVTEPVEESPEATAGTRNSQRKPRVQLKTIRNLIKKPKEKILSLAKRKKTISWNSRLKI